ncbi:hypothetical protein CCOS865_02960 [Pseudomonas reidholzensis]|uniref:Uncharacterized protein n=2 Tax=Pseudomonas reidholzensis TaxID=1785162 RepID=A0A383RV85_9PSED|nr:hypothetical protein CCOS865_02960 [Pseudomonas reidholzensis]
MTLKASVLACLCLAAAQPALAGDDKTRVLVAKRWYTEAYVRQHLAKVSAAQYGNVFHPSIAYHYAANAPATGGKGDRFIALDMSTRHGGAVRWSAEREARGLSSVTDEECLSVIGASLASLKFQVKRELTRSRARAKSAVITEIRSGALKSAPLDLNVNRGRPITIIPPEGEGRLLCNVYKSSRGSMGITYDYSVVLTASGFYMQPR